MLSYSRPIERCRPLLGTFVRICVRGLPPERAHSAIEVAFDEIAQVHRLMSFHEPDSDVSRLNRNAHIAPTTVDTRTFEVLLCGLNISALSGGAFDVAVAPLLVQRGVLPTPAGAPVPDPAADWRDIELIGGRCVRFKRPLWIDLGGIAKGYAVDRAIAVLATHRATQAIVNAGGDLRVIGAAEEQIFLSPDHCEMGEHALVALEDGALASSCGTMHGAGSVHVDTRTRSSTRIRQHVSVAAPRCVDADALTKVVMALDACSMPILARFDARAFVHDAQFGWRQFPRVPKS